MRARRQFVSCSLAVIAAFLALGAPSAHAHGHRVRPPAPPPLVSISLLDGHGSALPTVTHRGQTFVAGDHGDRYEIRVQNNSADRLEIVLSVDGRDAVSGRLADFRTARGYVVEPFDTVVVDGFRTSLDAVAAFRFSTPADSFAGRNGTPQHAGLVAVAVFKERRAAIARRHTPLAAAATPPATKQKKASPHGWDSERAEQQLGTEFGEQRDSRVRLVAFVRARTDRPDLSTTLRYDTAEALAERGVPIARHPVFATPPQHDGWPGAVDDRFTAPPPPRWR